MEATDNRNRLPIFLALSDGDSVTAKRLSCTCTAGACKESVPVQTTDQSRIVRFSKKTNTPFALAPDTCGQECPASSANPFDEQRLSIESNASTLTSPRVSSLCTSQEDEEAPQLKKESAAQRVSFQVDLEKVASGQDQRTTVMIKNIPNKYTQKMLLQTIDQHLAGQYDFLYLPIDFKNRCNMGYAFINLTSPQRILTLAHELFGKRWERFNSDKVCDLAYARIQGKEALVSHFQSSSVMFKHSSKVKPLIL